MHLRKGNLMHNTFYKIYFNIVRIKLVPWAQEETDEVKCWCRKDKQSINPTLTMKQNKIRVQFNVAALVTLLKYIYAYIYMSLVFLFLLCG
jgi:hypothetical protein